MVNLSPIEGAARVSRSNPRFFIWMEHTFFLLLRIAPKLVRANIIGILRPEIWRAVICAIIPSFLVQFWTLDPRVLVQNSDGTKRAAPYGNVTVMEHLSCYNPTSNLGAAQKNRHFERELIISEFGTDFELQKSQIRELAVSGKTAAPTFWTVCTTPR